MSYLNPNLIALRDSLSTNREVMYKLPSNFASIPLENLTYFNTTPTVTAVGPYDKFVVTSGAGTIIGINNVYRTIGDMVLKMKIKVNTLGTTNPVIGIYYYGASLSDDIDSDDLINVLDLKNAFHAGATPAIISNPARGSQLDITTAVSASPLISSGDTIEIEIISSMTNCEFDFFMRNLGTGSYALGRSNNVTQDRFRNYVQNVGIYLIDGTYTILDLTIESLIPKKPKVHVIGDSMGRGSLVTKTQALPYKVPLDIHYNIANSACGGANITNLVRAELQDIIRLTPATVLMMHYVQLSFRAFEPANAGNAAYMVSWNALVKGILGVGSIPIFVKMPFWPFPIFGSNPAVDQATMNAWYTFVDTQLVAYPTALLLDLRPFTLTYDSTGYHYDNNSNTIIGQQVTQLLSTNGFL